MLSLPKQRDAIRIRVRVRVREASRREASRREASRLFCIIKSGQFLTT
ncbi:hypothetical protein WKK05_37950 (plasmid) [Nostoc sp. UHCC 0302]